MNSQRASSASRFAYREALEALIPAMLGAHGDEEEGDDSLLQGITRGSFQGIMQDRLSSHVMEVCLLHFVWLRTLAIRLDPHRCRAAHVIAPSSQCLSTSKQQPCITLDQRSFRRLS